MAEKINVVEKNNDFLNNALEDLTGGIYAYKAYKEFTASDVNYEIFNLQAEYQENQAANIELQAEQNANLLREQFNEAVGTYKHTAARRGVKVGEGSTAQNIEKSAEELGVDVQTMRTTAKHKAGQLRSRADQYRSTGKGAKEIGKWAKISRGLTDLSKASTALGLTGKKKKKKDGQ